MSKPFTFFKIFFLLLLFGVAASAKSQGNSVIVEAVGLEVGVGDNALSFGANNTAVAVKIRLDRDILKLSESGSKLLSITDQSGVDLLRKGMVWRKSQRYFSMGTVENGINFPYTKVDGKEVIFHVNVTALPTKGVKTINLKASIDLLCYPTRKKNRKIMSSGPVNLPMGVGKFNLPNAKVVEFVQEGSGSINGRMVKFIAPQTDVILMKMSYLDKAGKVLQTFDDSNISGGNQLPVNESIVQDIKKVVVEYYEPEVITVPVDLSVGVGL